MSRHVRCLLLSIVFIQISGTAFGQFGAMMTGVGPINRSMGGAATAAPLDTLGAFYWNPATISALPNSTDFGLELLIPQSHLSSSINANSFGAGVPPVNVAGSSRSSAAVFPLPEFGLVYHPTDSYATYGIGLLAVGGFSTNFPGSSTNPVLTPPPPNGFGLGPVMAQYQLLQIVPTMALELTDRLSVGFSPMIDLATLNADPGVFGSPDPATGIYPSLTHGAYTWGAGFQAGAYYKADNDWHFGASFKSPQWFQNFNYNASTPAGVAQHVSIGVNAPMIASIGTSYTGIDRTTIAVDARYLDYRNTVGFAHSGFGPNGEVLGLGWKGIYALSAGTQYKLTDFTSVRMGYSFGTNPIPNNNTFFNIASPLVIQHGIYMGVSRDITKCFKVSLTYAHYFQNSISGLMISPIAGPLGGTNVTSSASADSIIAGASFLF